MNNKKKCFVIMPISKSKSCSRDEWAGIFDHMIKPAVTGSKLGFDCEQAKPRTGALIKDILEKLNRADVVIADLTDKNPNVFYELGIRHTLKNRTILITQNINHVPSDLRSYWVVTYKKDLTGASEFKKGVREILREMQKDPDKPDSPVADFLENRNISIISTEKSANVRKLTALISEISFNINEIKNTAKQLAQSLPPTSRLQNTCIKLILSTRYINMTANVLNDISLCDRMVDWFNQQLVFAHQSLIMDLDEIPKRLATAIQPIEDKFTSLLGSVVIIRIDFANDNYQEPKEQGIILSTPELEKYLQ